MAVATAGRVPPSRAPGIDDDERCSPGAIPLSVPSGLYDPRESRVQLAERGLSISRSRDARRSTSEAWWNFASSSMTIATLKPRTTMSLRAA
eukprot:CAMPEP_0181187690 /NCGR_PEP_ID=MMETSP1096-20121128/10710_1 /TAXON_ID=156174 ORGANISM="Chrysochromulina ericina, Strain CCMP281" /NCGR_SAMPLE_ID=MMETSP1096 /ASSEMBLY_ACC=CAM_ASM_000453 /LENGTH=91 /DNA_ID=CAMNT_0023276687 /DNA_START=549 /DNA_END=824 /DNA_ORIENTATION=-